MAKDTTAPKTEHNPFTPAAAPLFSMSREALAELDRQAERWLDYGNAQLVESLKVTRAMMAQSMAASRAFLDAAEEATNRSLQGISSTVRPFTGAQA
jgi:hypothetical protein